MSRWASEGTKRGTFRGTRPRVFTTTPDDPFEGSVCVGAWTQWFERIEGESGAVAFTPVASSESDLMSWLRQQEPGVELNEIQEPDCKDVIDEFLDQVPLFPEAPEVSSETPFSEQRPDDDTEHY